MEFQWTAPPLGLHASPNWNSRLAQVVEKILRRQGVHLIWDVNDILILGDSQETVSTNLEILLQASNDSDFFVNQKKSKLTPSQQVNYLGKQINLRNRMVGPQPTTLSRGLGITNTTCGGGDHDRRISLAWLGHCWTCRRSMWPYMAWKSAL